MEEKDMKIKLNCSGNELPIEILSSDNVRRAALPPNWKMVEYSTDIHSKNRSRKIGEVVIYDDESFINYIKNYKVNDQTSIYCNSDFESETLRLVCIFNDNHISDEFGGWKDFYSVYEPKYSPEWKRWSASNKRTFSQIEFAEFIEENIMDIVQQDRSPSGHQLLEMALSFDSTQNMRFKSAIRLQNGAVEMNFIESDDDQTLTKMKMFEKISIGIPVFRNGDAYRVDARVRYRVKEGKLTFCYELIRKDKIFEEAAKTIITKIRTETDVNFYYGR